jgi:cellobiose phosphorylase
MENEEKPESENPKVITTRHLDNQLRGCAKERATLVDKLVEGPNGERMWMLCIGGADEPEEEKAKKADDGESVA